MLITITDTAASRGSAPPAISHPGDRSPQTAERRLRILRLRRPPGGSYGFHLRGGREHGTGFFISHVDPKAEAFAQGLRTGDQVVRINDLAVSGALHQEAAALVRAGNTLTLHVKSTGLVPVKNNKEDNLSWVLVGPDCEVSDPISETPLKTIKYATETRLDETVQVVISGAGKNTLGCSICKGPPEKPGIFVQRVRERGLAEIAGLRAGDKITACNGVSFVGAEFQQAVQSMKSSPKLRLEVIRGAGLDLIAGESSGYNSSASSETGEENYPLSEVDSGSYAKPTLTSKFSSMKLGAMKDGLLNVPQRRRQSESDWAEEQALQQKRAQLISATNARNKKTSTLSSLGKKPSKSNDRLLTNGFTPSPPCNTCHHLSSQVPVAPEPPQNRKSSISKNSDFKIAVQTSHDPHVSKIVVTPKPRDERNALLRLERLSSGEKNGSVSSCSLSSALLSHNKTGSISSTSSEEASFLRNSSSAYGISPKDHVTRCVSVPSEDDPNPNISGRFTSRIQIRSSPPPPPPRGDTTRLTRTQRRSKLGRRRANSPCASVSSGDFVPHFRTRSFESISASSDESLPWDDACIANSTSLAALPKGIPPPPPPPSNVSQTKCSSGVIPPPPPPPPAIKAPSNGHVSIRQQELSEAASRLKPRSESATNVTKKPPPDPKKAQHDQLMDEFKRAHAMMVAKRQPADETDA